MQLTLIASFASFIALTFSPQEITRDEWCGMLEINHIVTASPAAWGGGVPQLQVQSYWLGRREYRECEGVHVVDWWQPYRSQDVWHDGRGGVLMGLTCRRTGRFVVIHAREFRETTTDFDIEVEQRREIKERWGLDHGDYRRGLAGAGPQ